MKQRIRFVGMLIVACCIAPTYAEPSGSKLDVTRMDPGTPAGRINLDIVRAHFDVRIDVVPESDRNIIELDDSGRVPVAVLSTATFDATKVVDRSTLSFGPTGEEQSFASCQTNVRDVNGDGLPDLVCLFSVKIAGFRPGDTVGVLKGRTVRGVSFRGQDTVSARPKERGSDPKIKGACSLPDGTTCQTVWPF